MPTVSVIMCVFNTNDEQMLRLSIYSILSQSFYDFEFIICDDGSTDGTFQTLLDICKCDSRIKLVRNKKNTTSGAARNRCIAMSQGEFIAIMDADDFSRHDRLQCQVDFLERNKEYDFVGASAGLFAGNSLWGHRKYKSFPEEKDFLFVLPFVHASVVFRKSSLMIVGGYRVAWETVRVEDYDLFMRMYAHGVKGANLDKELYFIREDQATLKRRKYWYRINEVMVRYKGFRALGLMPRGFFYVIKPIVVGIIPQILLKKLKNMYYKETCTGGT